ncbi:MAG: argininosuccinate lyase, partial [Roseivirga sp.]
ELIFPTLQDLKDCLFMAEFMLAKIKINDQLIAQDKYNYLFTVEEVNRLVLSGVPFRDAYKKVGLAIEKGEFKPDRKVNHSHEGSIGQLNHPEINAMMTKAKSGFYFEKWEKAFEGLVK